jgi:hypothetical protein
VTRHEELARDWAETAGRRRVQALRVSALVRLLTQIAAEERERCAALCDARAARASGDRAVEARECGAAIRMLGGE